MCIFQCSILVCSLMFCSRPKCFFSFSFSFTRAMLLRNYRVLDCHFLTISTKQCLNILSYSPTKEVQFCTIQVFVQTIFIETFETFETLLINMHNQQLINSLLRHRCCFMRAQLVQLRERLFFFLSQGNLFAHFLVYFRVIICCCKNLF